MSQNLFAYVARAFGGGAATLNLDADGNLLVNTSGASGEAVNITKIGGDAVTGPNLPVAVVTLGDVVLSGTSLPVTVISPVDTPVADSSADVANAAAVATLPATAGFTTLIQGLALTGMGATAAGQVVATVTGLLGGTLSFVVPVPAGADVGIAPLVLQFPTPLVASAEATAIVVTLPALGVGNLHAVATAWGIQR